MNILYLHGLKSKLSPEKRKVIEQYGEVFAPDINYKHQHIQPVDILKKYKDIEFNVVIGSSMGALNAYIVSENIGKPALIFNPPLSRYQPTKFKSFYLKGLAYKQILLGGNDDVVDPSETMTFLGKHLKTSELNIKIDPLLGHRIPVSVFEEQLETFFSKLCY